MKVVIHKGGGKTVEFQMDIEFEYLLGCCNFYYMDGYIGTSKNSNNAHLFSGFGNKTYCQLHQLLYYLKTGIMSDINNHIDHIDQDRSNNKMENLRLVSQVENKKNRPLRCDQKYYNIYDDKHNNRFTFYHHETKHRKSFTHLKDALDYFTEYDNANDNVLTKHIANIKPISEVKLVERDPPIKCELCETYTISKQTMIRHMRTKHRVF